MLLESLIVIATLFFFLIGLGIYCRDSKMHRVAIVEKRIKNLTETCRNLDSIIDEYKKTVDSYEETVNNYKILVSQYKTELATANQLLAESEKNGWKQSMRFSNN